MTKSLEQTRVAERLEVQLLKTSLDEMSQQIQEVSYRLLSKKSVQNSYKLD